MSLSKERQNRAPKGKSQTNTHTCYIASIPDDILLEIFSTFLPDAMNELLTPFQKTLIAVCRSWRDMVMGTPLLWTKIGVPSITSNDTLVHFERSKPALIDVKFDTTWNQPKPERLQLIRDTIAKHVSRLRSLTVRVVTSQDVEAIFSRWKGLETPNLTTLDISSIGSATWTEIILGSTMPRVRSWKDIDARALRFLQLGSFDIQDFPLAPNLTSLDIKTMKLSPTNFQMLFEKFPLLDTLVIQNSEISPPLSQQDHSNLSKLNAPSLRSLAINLGTYHTESCGCMLPFLSVVMKNLEYLEVADFSSDLTPHHASIFAQWPNLPHLLKLRIQIDSHEVWMDDISFLSSLSKATDLEITHFPKNVDFALLYVLSLTNLHSITFNLDPAAASISETFYHDYQPYLDVEELSTIVCHQKPKLGCPTILRLPGDQKVDPQLTTILGDSLTITTTSSEQGFLDVTRNVRFHSDDDESIGGHSYDEDPDYNSDSLEFIEYSREDDDYEYSDSDLYDHYDDGEYADDYTTDGLGWD